MREKLVSELKLSAEQQAALDAISTELRPKFMAVRDLPEEQRPAAREKVTAEMRSKITEMLTPDQRTRYKAMLAGAASNAGPVAGSAASPAGSAGGVPSVPAGPSGGPANAQTEFRNRLVSELQLTPDQVAKVDAIYAESRGKFMGLRDLAPEERGKARDRLTADIRARIGDVLTPEQKPKYAALVAEAASRTSTRGRIYVMDEQGKPKAYAVRLGISDGTSTELIVGPNNRDAGVLKEGADVVIGLASSVASRSSATPPRPNAAPRLGF